MGYLFGGPYNKDNSILGSILRSPNFGKLPYLSIYGYTGNDGESNGRGNKKRVLQALRFGVHDVLISSWVYQGCRMFQGARTQNP